MSVLPHHLIAFNTATESENKIHDDEVAGHRVQCERRFGVTRHLDNNSNEAGSRLHPFGDPIVALNLFDGDACQPTSVRPGDRAPQERRALSVAIDQ